MRAARSGADVAVVTAGLSMILLLTGCSAEGKQDEQQLTVLAAASLTESFTALAEEFEVDHEGVDVRLAFDSSATLSQQIIEGAPADVLATADERTMTTALDADAVRTPEIFATNTLVLVVPADNPAGVRSAADLADESVSYVVCDESAPCGALARTVLDEAGITAAPRSLEVDVKSVLSKVTLDEADAGLVYATDAIAAGGAVRTVALPHSGLTTYPIAVVADAEHPELAEDWLGLVSSETGRRILSDAGFKAP